MRLTPGILQLISLLLAPLAALAGVWLGPYLTSRVERRRWQRDRKEQAYLAVLQAVDSMRMYVMQDLVLSNILNRVRKKTTAPLKDSGRSSDEEQDTKVELSLDEIKSYSKEYIEESQKEFYEPLIRARSQAQLFGNSRIIELLDEVTDHLIAAMGASNEGEHQKAVLAAYASVQALIIECRKDLDLPAPKLGPKGQSPESPAA